MATAPYSSPPRSSLSSSAAAHFPDVQWANFWASLLLRYQQTHHSHPRANPVDPASSPSTQSPSSALLPFSPAPPLNLAIGLAELLLDLLAILPNCYFLLLLTIRRDLHNNLRVLLGSFSLCLILIAITRVPTQVNYIFTGVLYVDVFRWLVFGHEIGVMFFRTIIVPLTIERVLATVRSKNYEQQQSPLIGILAVLLTLIISTAIGLYIGHELNESRIQDGVISFRGDFYGLYHVIDVSARLFIWILCFGVFVTLLQYNQRCYAFARLPNKHTLVQRYQFAENVRSSRLLLVVGIIVFVCNLHFDFVMLRIAYNKDHFDVEYSQSFDFVLAVALNAIPIAAIWFHPSMFAAFKSHAKAGARLFLAHCCCIRSASFRGATDEPDSPTFLFPIDPQKRQIQKSPRALLSGQKLIVRRDEEQHVYFEELQKSWNERKRKEERMGRRGTGQGQNLI